MERAVEFVARQLMSEDLDWALTGSVSHALRGADLKPRDLDVQTSRSGAYRIVEILSEYCTRPVEYRATEAIRSYFGALQVEGVDVEVMGAVQTRSPDRSWMNPVDVSAHREFVKFQGCKVPVMSLEHEVLAYERLGRAHRALLLRQLLEAGRRRDD